MQEFYYRRVEDGTFCLTGYEGDEAEVVIPDDKVFTILSDKVFRGHDEITSIKIPDSVTDMGEFLFDGCVNLRHLQLPAELRTLWGYTFVRCGIEEIVLPDHLRIIPPFAFKDCKNLRKVVCGADLRLGFQRMRPALGGLPDPQAGSRNQPAGLLPYLLTIRITDP